MSVHGSSTERDSSPLQESFRLSEVNWALSFWAASAFVSWKEVGAPRAGPSIVATARRVKVKVGVIMSNKIRNVRR